MLKIFISSVQKEFVTERAAIRDYIRSDALLLRFFDVFLFEDLPASDRRAVGVRAPEFRQSGGQFVQTLWRPKAAISAQNDRPVAQSGQATAR